MLMLLLLLLMMMMMMMMIAAEVMVLQFLEVWQVRKTWAVLQVFLHLSRAEAVLVEVLLMGGGRLWIFSLVHSSLQKHTHLHH